MKTMEFDLKRLLSGFTDKKSKLLLLVGVIGMLLIFLSGLIPEKEDRLSESAEQPFSAAAYVESLSDRLASFISSIEGAGETKVLIMLENGGEDHYLKAESADRMTGPENETSAYSEEYVLTDGKDGRSAVLVSSFEPEIRGVAVICEGGDDAAVRTRVTDAVTTLFRISSARVSVSKMSA